MLTARLLLDGNDLNEIRHYAYKNVNKSLLSGFTLESKSIFDLESVYNTIREKETFKKDVNGYDDCEWVKLGLIENGLWGYLFRCLHCGKHLLYVDCD